MCGQLTGGIAHDFNNMLGVVIGSLELMDRRIKNGDFAIGTLHGSGYPGHDARRLANARLLAFARQQPLEPRAVRRQQPDYRDVGPDALHPGRADSDRDRYGGRLWTATADPHQLESAILNVAINARDAMPDGGKLTIETGNTYLDDAYARQHGEVEPGQYVMVAVSDNGTGMAPDVAARVFDPFFTTKPSGKGTGLGLSQVFGFIKQSKGHIKIYSEVGCGTTVKIYLPRLTDQAAIAMPTALPAAPAVGAGEVILVVEDDPHDVEIHDGRRSRARIHGRPHRECDGRARHSGQPVRHQAVVHRRRDAGHQRQEARRRGPPSSS